MKAKLQVELRGREGPLLEVTDLHTHFKTARGLVRSVDGVSFTLDRGKALGIVGESGSGKTVLSRSIIGLLPPRGTVKSGSVRFEARRSSTCRCASDSDVGQGDVDDLPGSDDVAEPGYADRRPDHRALRLHLGMSRPMPAHGAEAATGVRSRAPTAA